MIQGRNSDLHRERKHIRKGINEGKIIPAISFFLFCTDLTVNNSFKIIATMCW